MIYVPNVEDYQCVIVYNNETLRAYTTTPTHNNISNYTDYYVNSHYLQNSGSQQFSQYASLPNCLNGDILTDNIFYRNDIVSILLLFVLLVVIIGFPVWIIVKRFFKGRRRF